MRTRRELASFVIDQAFQMLADNARGLQIDEALFIPPGGYRSSLAACGTRSTRARATLTRSSPGLKLRIPAGLRCLDELPDDAELDSLRPMHWGELKPLFDNVATIARHHVYHAGEINQLLSIARGEAWEEHEEVEVGESHISTVGHRVRPPWLSAST